MIRWAESQACWYSVYTHFIHLAHPINDSDCFSPCACVFYDIWFHIFTLRHEGDMKHTEPCWERSTQIQIQAHTQNMPEAWPLQRAIEGVRKGEPERKQGKEWLMQILGWVCCEQACLDSLAAGLMTSSLGSSGVSLAQILFLWTLIIHKHYCFLQFHKKELCKYTYLYVLYPHHHKAYHLSIIQTVKDFV